VVGYINFKSQKLSLRAKRSNDMSLIRKIRYHTDNGKSLRSLGGGLRLCEPDPPYAPYAGIYRNPYQLAWDTTRFLPSVEMTASFVIPNECEESRFMLKIS